MALESVDPGNGKTFMRFEELSGEAVKSAIESSHQEYLSWRKTSFERRKQLMLRLSEVLLEQKEKYARLMTREMGKPLKQALAEIEKCSWVCEYYANNAEDMLARELIETDATSSYVQFDPIGVVLAVMPWNFPFWQVFRFAAPTIMAGNTGLLKHASNVPQCAIGIEELFRNAGFPETVFTNLLIGSKKVKEVIDHPFVKAATLTGSEFAGREIAKSCGERLKKTVMELGGSDPFILLEDADIDEAVKWAVTARIINNGQSCIAAKRFIVDDKIGDEFETKFADKMSKVVTGDPMNMDTELGPIAREDLLNELDTQVKKSVSLGAKLLTGGKRIEGEGYFYPATVLSNVSKGMPAYDEEIFGPVASVIRAKDTTDAIRIANDSAFGLGASLWTSDLDKAERHAGEINAGSVFINGMVKSDPRLPFGGINISGYGRELSHYGIKEFVNIKSVWIK